jgi:phage/plasmid-like protein (TIGR03299 family)
MAYAGAIPWHGLGVRVSHDLSPEQMIEKARLTWSVEALDCTIMGKFQVPNFRALTRRNHDGSIDVFGPCGPRYVPVQNKEAFAFFKQFTEAGDMQLEVAGSLKGGRYVWALAKFNGELDLAGDITKNYILLVSPHIWGHSLKIFYTPVRVVCNNTLTQALNGGSDLDRFRHIHTVDFDQYAIAKARGVLKLANIAAEEFAMAARLLANIKVNADQASKYFATLFKPQLVTATEMERLTDITVDHWMRVLKSNPGHDTTAANDTAWGLLNAVTYGLDHLYGRSEDARLENSWMGANARKKHQALENALALAA